MFLKVLYESIPLKRVIQKEPTDSIFANTDHFCTQTLREPYHKFLFRYIYIHTL